MISTSSVFCTVVLYSIALGCVCALGKSTTFLKKCGVSVLLLIAGVFSARMLLPFELPFTYTVPSWTLLGVPLRFLREHPEVEQFLVRLWVAGFIFTMTWDVAVLGFARMESRKYVPVKNPLVEQTARRLGVTCPVLVSPDVESPYVAGILHHTIYFPAAELSERHIELTLTHEMQHIRSHDALIKFFFAVMSDVMWWNPVARIFRKTINVLLEFSCDAKVTARMNIAEQTDYMGLLTVMARKLVSKKKRWKPALVLDESYVVTLQKRQEKKKKQKKSIVERRFDVIRDLEGRPSRRVTAAEWCALLMLVFASYLVVFQPAMLAPEKNFQDNSEISYEEHYDGLTNEGRGSTFIFKGSDGRYQLFVNYEFSRYLTEDEVTSDEFKDLLIADEERER